MLIFENEALKNIEIIYKLLQNEYTRTQFFNLEKFPWYLKIIFQYFSHYRIPGPNNINLKKGIGSAIGSLMENNSPLGIILRPSFLPNLLENPKDKESHEKILEKISEMRKKDKKTSLKLQQV